MLRANANLVLVDVVVTDRDRPITGLDKARFHIFEDGHEQPITAFDEHKPGAAPTNTAGPIAGQLALPPHTYTNVPLYPDMGAVNVLLLDGLNTPMPNQIQVRQQMIQYLAKITPGTSLAIFTLSSRLRLVEGFTTDAAQLTKAIESRKAGPQASVILDTQSDQTIDSAVGEMAGYGADPDAVGAMQQFQADLTAFQTDERVRMTLDAMQQLARYLSGIPGRKNLIWFSGSFPIALDPDDSLQSPFEAMRNYSDEIRETAELLSASRVAVYPVDARDLLTPPSADASYSPSTNLVGGGTSTRRGKTVISSPTSKPNVGKDDQKFMQQLMQEQATMEQIAGETGGRDYINTNGLKEAVASAIENGSIYYTIGYVPPAAEVDGKFHKIELRVKSADYKLAYRHGYYADPTAKPSEHNPGQTSLVMAATLHGAPPSTQILFQARVLEAADPLLKGKKLPDGPAGELSATLKSPVHRYIVDLKVDPRRISLEDTPDGVHHAKVEFALVAYDGEGKRINYKDAGYQLNLIPAQYASVMTNGIPVRLAIDLPAGQAFLRIAVHDLNAGRGGSMEVPVTVAVN